MNIRIILCTAAAVIFLPFFCAHGQEGEPISLRFLAFPPQNSPEPIELLVGENKTMTIDIPGNELSRAYKLKGLTSIVVGLTMENAEKEKVFQVLGQAPALSSSQQIVLLLRKGDRNSDGFTVIPIEGDLAKFKGGNFYFFNVSKLTVGGKIGDKIFALKPGQNRLLEPSATHADDGCQVTLSYQRPDKWKTFYDTRWTTDKRIRCLVFFFQDPESQRLSVAPIMEILR
jgi:hypothetical protein